jgi:hypothetical protein
MYVVAKRVGMRNGERREGSLGEEDYWRKKN